MTPRTIATMFAVGTVSLLMLSGFAFGSTGSVLEGQFQWEPHRIGDQGEYSVTLVDAEGNILDAKKPLLEFQLLSDRLLLDSTGSERHVLPFAIDKYQGSDQNGDGVEEDWEPAAITLFKDIESHELVAYGHVRPHSLEIRDGYVHESGYESYILITDPDQIHMDCMMFSKYAGTTIDLSTTMSYWEHCGWHDYWSPAEVTATRDVGTYDGRGAVVLQTTFNPLIQVTLVEGIPYPVELLVEQQHNRGQFHLIRLESFTPGNRDVPDPLPTLLEHAFSDLQTSEWDRLPFGTVENLPYPLMDAIDQAVAHADGGQIVTFMEEHPEWYVFEATNLDFIQDDFQSYAWVLSITDGDEALAFRYDEVRRPIDDYPLGMLPLPSVPTDEENAGQEVERSVEYLALQSTAYVGRNELPQRLPLLTAFESRWTKYTGDLNANSIRFGLYCEDSVSCEDPMMRINVERRVVLMNSETGETSYESSHLNYLHHRVIGDQWDISSQYQRQTRVTPDTVDLIVAPTPVDPSATSAVWSPPPSGFVAAVGATGALGILAVLLMPFLKHGGAAGLFSRIRTSHLLDHPKREELMIFIREHPGAHLRQIRDHLDMGSGTADHHLRKMATGGLVTIVRKGNYACYFPTGSVDRRVQAAVPAMKAKGAKAIVHILLDHPSTQTELVKQTGLSRGTLSYHIHKLEEADAVAIATSGRSRRIELTDIGRQAVQAA